MRLLVVLMLIVVCYSIHQGAAHMPTWSVSYLVPRCANLMQRSIITINGAGFTASADAHLAVYVEAEDGSWKYPTMKPPLVGVDGEGQQLEVFVTPQGPEYSLILVEQYGVNKTVDEKLLVLQAPPLPQKVTPETGWRGDTITVYGKHFADCSPVCSLDDGKSIGTCDYVSDTKLVCTVPTCESCVNAETDLRVSLDGTQHWSEESVMFRYAETSAVPDIVYISIAGVFAGFVLLIVSCVIYHCRCKRLIERNRNARDDSNSFDVTDGNSLLSA